LYRQNAEKIAQDAIEEINIRFKERAVGYQFVTGEIVRVDSQFMHSEVVKPAIALLNGEFFSGPQEEFLAAHEHYRHGDNKAALNECLKAFESTMKAIFQKRKWAYNKTGTAKELIRVCFEKGLIPSFWETSFAGLRSLLESSVPTGRNKLGGHGQGAEHVAVPEHLVAYMLHMTASAIVFLCEADKNLS
jgi:hypothetical protein